MVADGPLDLDYLEIVVLLGGIVDHIVVVQVQTDGCLERLDQYRGKLYHVHQLDGESFDCDLTGQGLRGDGASPGRTQLLFILFLVQRLPLGAPLELVLTVLED